MTAPAPTETFQLVHRALTDPESDTSARTARLLAMLVANLEAVEILDRAVIDEMVIQLG